MRFRRLAEGSAVWCRQEEPVWEGRQRNRAVPEKTSCEAVVRGPLGSWRVREPELPATGWPTEATHGSGTASDSANRREVRRRRSRREHSLPASLSGTACRPRHRSGEAAGEPAGEVVSSSRMHPGNGTGSVVTFHRPFPRMPISTVVTKDPGNRLVRGINWKIVRSLISRSGGTTRAE